MTFGCPKSSRNSSAGVAASEALMSARISIGRQRPGARRLPLPPIMVSRAHEVPPLVTQYELDSTSCLGERNKANLSGVTFTGGGIAGMVAAQNRAHAADTVQRGCMAEKGYLLVQEDQAEAKQAELAAIAEQKRQQEAAAAAPPMKPRKPAAKPTAPPAT
jgi:hypothetical protein